MKFIYFIFILYVFINVSISNKIKELTISEDNINSDWNQLIQKFMRKNQHLPVNEVETGIQDILDKSLNEDHRFLNKNPVTYNSTNKPENITIDYYNKRFYRDYYDPVFSNSKKSNNKRLNTDNNIISQTKLNNSNSGQIKNKPTDYNNVDRGKNNEDIKEKFSNNRVSVSMSKMSKKKMDKRTKLNKKKTFKKKVKKGKRSKIIESSKSFKSGIRVDVIKNRRLPIKIRFTKKVHTFVKCEKKTGFLNYLENTDNLENGFVTTVPIYIILTKSFLKIFSSIKENSLIFSLKLDSIQRIDQSLKGTFCFDIIVNDVINIETLKTSKSSFCAYNYKEMQEWIMAILQFKECSISKMNMDHNGKVLLDFTKINDINMSKKVSTEYTLANSYYDGTDTTFKKPIQEKVIGFNHEMKEIQDILNLGRIARLQLKRRLRGRLAKSRMATSTLLSKEGLVKSMIEKKMSMIKNTEQMLIRKENKIRKRKLIENLKHKIQILKAKELKDYQASYETEIKFEREKSMNEAQSMMKLLMEQEKLENYSICLSEKLFKFRNHQFIDKFCYKYFGEYGKTSCASRIHFCDYCCENKIGIGFLERRASCKTKCNLLVTGEVKSLEEEVKKINKEFSKKYEKELEELMKGKLDSKDKIKKIACLLRKKMKASKNFKKRILKDLEQKSN